MEEKILALRKEYPGYLFLINTGKYYRALSMDAKKIYSIMGYVIDVTEKRDPGFTYPICTKAGFSRCLQGLIRSGARVAVVKDMMN